MNILVVDDQPDIRLLLHSFLMDQGWTVFLAEDGEQALCKMELARMDVIIADLYMPVMDGFKLHRWVRQIQGHEKTPFVLMSVSNDVHSKNVIKDPRIEAFYHKHSPVEELLSLIHQLTGYGTARPKLPPPEELHPALRPHTALDRRDTLVRYAR